MFGDSIARSWGHGIVHVYEVGITEFRIVIEINLEIHG